MVLAAGQAATWRRGRLQGDSQRRDNSNKNCRKREAGKQPFHTVRVIPLTALRRASLIIVSDLGRRREDHSACVAGCPRVRLLNLGLAFPQPGHSILLDKSLATLVDFSRIELRLAPARLFLFPAHSKI
jgi:hypothetical protein